MKLNFKILGSGYEIRTDTGANLGMIDRDVDGCFYWFPVYIPGTCIPAWILREILRVMDWLNLAEECNKSAARLTPERAEKLRAIFDAEELAMNTFLGYDSSLTVCSGTENVCMGKPVDTNL